MNFEFKEQDDAGKSTLEILSKADQLNRWMFDTIKPFCSGEILEIGSGIGNLSEFFIKNRFSITLSDIRKNYCDSLKDRFANNKFCKGIIRLDISDSLISDNPDYPYKSTFDTIFSLNVIEHIKNDAAAVKNCFSMLKPGGTLIILVPAGKFLYNNFDRELEHFRRYNKKELTKLLQGNGFNVKKIHHFNFIGIFGWFFFGNILKRKLIPDRHAQIFNFFVPIIKLFDTIVFRKSGLSLIIYATKENSR